MKIQDILITMSIGIAFFMVIIAMFGAYSPTTRDAYQEQYNTMDNITQQTTEIWNVTRTQGDTFTTGISEVDALTGALAGLTTLTITIGQTLLTSLITAPLMFLDLLYEIGLATVEEIAPEYSPIVVNLKGMIYTIIVVMVVLGITFKMLLKVPDEII